MSVITVCSDDFGLTPGICRGIIECLEYQQVSATSCMTGCPSWPRWAAQLRPFAATADIGLHFTLTDHQPIGTAPTLAPNGRFPSFPRMLQQSLVRRLPGDEIQAQFDRQLDAFEDAFGLPPTHVDGHHHIHQLPGIREIIVATLAKRYASKTPYVRVTRDTLRNIWQRGIDIEKCMRVGLFGSSLRTLADRSGLATNEGFSGIYNFRIARRSVAELFERFLVMPGPRMLIMCHPGHSNAELEGIDCLTNQREAELAFLLGNQWPALMARNGIKIAPLFMTNGVVNLG